MKKTLILCLLAFCFASAAKKDIAIFHCIRPVGSDLDMQTLTNRLQQIIRKELPPDDYTIVPYEAAKEKLAKAKYGGDEEAAEGAISNAECSASGECSGVLKDMEIDYAARCEVKKVEGKLVFSFSLEDRKGFLDGGDYNEKYNPKYNPKKISDFIEIMEKEVPIILQKVLFGKLEVKPAYKNDIGKEEGKWSLYVNNVERKSYVNSFPPGEYNIRLSHKCYETIDSSVTITKGRTELFDVAKYLDLRTGELVLTATRNDKPADGEVVFVDGNQLGKTPYTSTVPSCSDIRIGRNKEKVEVKLLPNERVVYTHPMSLVQKTSTFIAIGLDVLGAAAIGYGVYENMKASNAYDDYGKRGQSAEYYDDAWEKAKSSTTRRNVFYIVGGAVLASGVAVHIWF